MFLSEDDSEGILTKHRYCTMRGRLLPGIDVLKYAMGGVFEYGQERAG